MPLFIPELTIRKYIEESITLIKESVNASLDDNLLVSMFDGVPVVGTLDYKAEALSLFRKDVSPFTVRIGYNIGTVKDLPIVLISLPTEEGSVQPVGLVSGDTVSVGETAEGSTIKVPEKEEFYRPSYRVSIVTANADMTVIIYNILKWMFLHRRSEMELDGMLLLKVHSQDVHPEQSMVPQTLYIRSLVLEFMYSITATPHEFVSEVGKSVQYDKDPYVIPE